MEKIFRQIQYPFSYGMSPFVEEINEKVLEWIMSFGLLPTEGSVKRYHEEKYVWWTARTFPFADKTGFFLVSCWTVLFFIADDMIVDAEGDIKKNTLESIRKHAVDILVHNKTLSMASEGGFGACFSDLWSKIRRHTNTEWQGWFITEMIKMLKSWQEESDLLKSGSGISLESYVQMRPYFSGGNVVACLLSLATKYNFPFSIYKLDTIQQMHLRAIRTASWANDIHSLGKELTKESADNMVLIFMKERELSLSGALKETLNVHNSDLAHLLELEDSLPSSDIETDLEVKRYVKAIKAMISGNHEWVLNDTNRYIETNIVMEKLCADELWEESQ